MDFTPRDTNGKRQTHLGHKIDSELLPGQCIQLAIMAKPQAEANGNADKIPRMYKLEVGYNKRLADGDQEP